MYVCGTVHYHTSPTQFNHGHTFNLSTCNIHTLPGGLLWQQVASSDRVLPWPCYCGDERRVRRERGVKKNPSRSSEGWGLPGSVSIDRKKNTQSQALFSAMNWGAPRSAGTHLFATASCFGEGSWRIPSHPPEWRPAADGDCGAPLITTG